MLRRLSRLSCQRPCRCRHTGRVRPLLCPARGRRRRRRRGCQAERHCDGGGGEWCLEELVGEIVRARPEGRAGGIYGVRAARASRPAAAAGARRVDTDAYLAAQRREFLVGVESIQVRGCGNKGRPEVHKFFFNDSASAELYTSVLAVGIYVVARLDVDTSVSTSRSISIKSI